MKGMLKELGVLASLVAVILAALAPVAPAAAAKDGYSFTTIDVSGASLTALWGTNPQGTVVGVTANASGAYGFYRKNGIDTTVDHGVNTTLIGVNPSGEIVGDYQPNPSEAWHWHGFRLTKEGNQVDISDSHESIVPMRILPDGTIVGFARESSVYSTQHGLIIRPDGTREYFEVPNKGSEHTGATPDGTVIVGYCGIVENGPSLAYVIDNGQPTYFAVPVAGTVATLAFDVHPGGKTIVGQYVTAGITGVKVHGFVAERRGKSVEEWIFKTVDFPETDYTFLRGTNANGDLVGFYNKGGLHGFVAIHIGE
jgi:hypothetical protein